jgi:hypothetical protein
MNARFWAASALVAVSVWGAGCSNDSADIDKIRTQTVTLTSSMVRDFGASLNSIQEMQALDSLSTGMDTLGRMSDRMYPPTPPPAPSLLPWGPRRSAQTESTDGTPGAAADSAADEINRILQDYVFTDENVEDSGSDWAIFRIKASTVCPKARAQTEADCDAIDWACETAGTATQSCLDGQAQGRMSCMEAATTDYGSCMEKVDAMEIRVKVTVLDGDNNLDVELMVGPGRANPIDFHLRPASIAVDLDLAAAKTALNHLAGVLGEEAPGLPAEFSGVLSFSLTKNGEQDFSAAIAILQALAVAGEFTSEESEVCTTYPDGASVCEPPVQTTHHVEITSAPADPLVAVRVQGLEKKLTVSLDLNRSKLTMPFAEVVETGSPTGNFIVDLAGINGEAVLQEGVEGLLLTGLGFGDGMSSVRHDDVVIASLDLNADNGRLLNQVTSIVDGWPTFAFDPGLFLDVYVNLGYMDAYLAVDSVPAPSFLRDQTYTLDLSPAALGTAQLTPFAAPVDGPNGDGVKVLAGTLTAATSADANATVTVGEGLCLFGTETVPVGGHELLGHFYAAVCE